MSGMWNFLQKQDLRHLSYFAKQIRQLNILEHLLMFIIIHSKYFSVSDSLKAYAQFTITTYWWPNLEEFCDLSTNNVKSAA